MQKGLFQIISDAYSSDWMIDPRRAGGYLSALQSRTLNPANFGKNTPKESALSAFTAAGKQVYTGDYNTLPPNSIAKVNVEGPLMRLDGMCSYGMASMAKMVRQADSSESISAIILEVDSPGGQVLGTEDFASAVRESSTPIYVMAHYAASAAYWVISGATEIWASGRTAEVGSIGTMVFFVDTLPMLEKQGAKVIEFYADDSKDKNRLFNEVRKGNYNPYISEKLNPLNDIFKANVREGRGLSDHLMTGKTYLAEVAIENGMIDRIGSMEELISHIRDENPNNVSNQNSNSNNMAQGSFKQNLLSAFGFSAKQVEQVSDEQAIEQLQNQVSEMETEAETNEKTISEQTATIKTHEETIASQKSTIETQRQRIKELEEANATLQSERDDAQQLAEQYGSQAGARPTAPVKKGQDVEQRETVDSTDKLDETHAHNQTADALLGD